MLKFIAAALSATLALGLPPAAHAASDAELQAIRDEIRQLKKNYETRIDALEKRLQQAEAGKAQAEVAASQSQALHVPAAAKPTNLANPDISLILQGTYKNLSQDPANARISGFLTNGETGPRRRGFSLAESELDLFANISPYLYGGINIAIEPDDKVGVEEAYIQTLGLSKGFTIKAGRYFSPVGYQNEIHQHAWDFYDAPLAHQAFLGTGPVGNYGNEGVQVKWLAPTDLFLELGAEIGRGRDFPGSDRNKNGIGASAAFAHVGGDIGVSQSYRAGLSFVNNEPRGRQSSDIDVAGATVTNVFSGSSRLLIADAIWKYAPNGDPSYTNLKLQGEYFYRWENGTLVYDVNSVSLGASSGAFSSAQSGFYLQGVYQFLPRWRAGLRGDLLFSGSVDNGANNANLVRSGFNPSKYTAMLDYSPTEFDRFRLQLAHDKSRPGFTDNQLILQFITSIGSHGAHQF
ncbi:MAG: carbohydrate porin [Burkholderiales bacterium]